VHAQIVSHRAELVLVRMRTGQGRDGALLASIALPGASHRPRGWPRRDSELAAEALARRLSWI
jgi:hypothetical protein